MELAESKNSQQLPNFEKLFAAEATGISVAFLGLAKVFEQVSLNSLQKMPVMTAEMQAQALSFFTKSATPIEIVAGGLALITLNNIIESFPNDNKLKNLSDNIKNSPQAVIGWVTQKLRSTEK